MAIETWLAFAAVSTILLVIPGPTVLLVVSYALGQGWRIALPTAVGVALGDFTAMTLSTLGVGALLATSAMWRARSERQGRSIAEYVETNPATCGFPAEVVQQLKQVHGKTEQTKERICAPVLRGDGLGTMRPPTPETEPVPCRSPSPWLHIADP